MRGKKGRNRQSSRRVRMDKHAPTKPQVLHTVQALKGGKQLTGTQIKDPPKLVEPPLSKFEIDPLR